jgi:subtilisin family serine protease
VYSDFGQAVWCCFPSNDFPTPEGGEPLTPGIWTTDQMGKAGYNRGGAQAKGDPEGHYTDGFGGTSSAAPGVAGVAALILSADPSLDWKACRDILKRAAVPIDKTGGNYSAEGHSPRYGWGRVDAARAVELVVRSRPTRSARAPRRKVAARKATRARSGRRPGTARRSTR